jgi:putative inorganic carbon (HCO3(-)) transporter
VESIRWELYPPELKARLTSPEFQQKIASNRIFGTFVYPNALAGGILFALPVSVVTVWNLSRRFSSVGRGVLTGLLACAGLVCLFWSGSKAGWLIMLGMALLAFVHLEQLSKRAKLISVLVLMTLGFGVFYAKHAGYFTKKTNSATARLDYWQAAWQTMKEKPLFGSGPGTFMINYQRLKRPESEPAKLAHNDYLQQGSDSGVIGLCTFLALMGGSVVVLYCRLRRKWDWGRFAVWLGVAGLAVQEFVEFSLYIPALAWPLFLFLGWLWAATELPLPQPPGPTTHA